MMTKLDNQQKKNETVGFDGSYVSKVYYHLYRYWRKMSVAVDNIVVSTKTPNPSTFTLNGPLNKESD